MGMENKGIPQTFSRKPSVDRPASDVIGLWISGFIETFVASLGAECRVNGKNMEDDYTGSTIRTFLHEKINPKDCRYCPLVM